MGNGVGGVQIIIRVDMNDSNAGCTLSGDSRTLNFLPKRQQGESWMAHFVAVAGGSILCRVRGYVSFLHGYVGRDRHSTM